jgi:Domain of unknown function (DUF4397)
MKNKFIKLTRALLPALVGIALLSCDDEHVFQQLEQPVASNAASVKFIHTAVGPAGTNFTINYFGNDNVKYTPVAISTGLPIGFGIGGTFPASINYGTVLAGKQTMKVVIPATTTVPESVLLTQDLNLEVGKRYSNFLVGFPAYTNYTIADDFSVASDPSKCYVRFINAITNTPAAGYDLVVTKTVPATSTTPSVVKEVAKFSNIGYLAGSTAFIAMEPNLQTESIAYAVQLRTAGTTTVIASTTLTPRSSRIYTFFSRGLVGGLSAGAPSTTVNIPAITFYTNR